MDLYAKSPSAARGFLSGRTGGNGAAQRTIPATEAPDGTSSSSTEPSTPASARPQRPVSASVTQLTTTRVSSRNSIGSASAGSLTIVSAGAVGGATRWRLPSSAAGGPSVISARVAV